MSEFSAETEGMNAFAATNAGVAAQIAAAANIDAVGNVVALTPVFGLIGGDYLAMFAAAQLLQAKDINDLSAKVGKLSDSAFNAAAAFTGMDESNAADLAAKAGGLM